MRKSGYIMLALVSLIALGGLGVGGHAWLTAHMQRWSGRSDLGIVSCDHCHLGSIEKLPWAKPRPHHASPAGLVVSPDGNTVYIALDDVNEVVAADAHNYQIIR